MADLCKYYKKQRYVSYNNGITWQPLEEYERGELYEAHSPSCGGGDFQYRWVLVEGAYICDNKNRYTKEVQQYSEDGTVWYNVFPTTYRKATLVEVNSPYCNNGGSGQYTSGDTEPTSGDTPSCPQGFFWNGNECECNGVVNASGKCEPCPDNYLYNKTTHECECQGHLDNNGNCIVCKDNFYWDESSKTCKCRGMVDEHGNCLSCQGDSHWDEQQKQCVCVFRSWEMRNGVCVYIDPLKTIKCDESDTVLSQEEVGYYENGWTLMSYTIGDCITEIGENAFNGQTIMTSVTISSSVTEVGSLAFANCQSLTSLTFPSNITYLGDNAFKDCIRLEQINFNGTIPNTLQPSLFSGCYSLQSASWLGYNNITSIGNSCFINCSSLSNVSFPNSLNVIGNSAFENCESISSITIPSNVTSIGYRAFMNCNSLTSVNIEADDILIGENGFYKCSSLTSVTVNSSAVTMYGNVFNDCISLCKITFTAPTPFEIEDGFFDNTNECMLFVPCESLQAYKTAWSQYEDRISCVDTGVYYRWIDLDTLYCDGTDEYIGQKQQSTTNGITWTDTGVYRPKELITHYSPNCGYQGDVALTVENADGFTRYYEPCQ